jgi:hypothetical protein
MGKKTMKLLTAALVFCSLTYSANASTVTVLEFDNIPRIQVYPGNPDTRVWAEKGFEVRPIGRKYYFGGFDNLHVDVAGEGDWEEDHSIARTDGAAFSLLSMDVLSGMDFYLVGPPGDDILFRGFLAGVQVATGYGSSQYGSALISFGAAFGNIDYLEILAIDMPSMVGPNPPGRIQYGEDYHYSFDNIRLGHPAPAMVPIPASGLLTPVALAGLFVARRRRRSHERMV